ncbi:unnamed protein product [Cylindrotheca closterium]|uniref:Palmitoyltransferase n=1 Tax=Cylindrotheca closterium TaxID=2856 RepID=A0AAD2FCS0_9STRA|nr:unnamed protein product [Cylindrotheca closterium]
MSASNGTPVVGIPAPPPLPSGLATGKPVPPPPPSSSGDETMSTATASLTAGSTNMEPLEIMEEDEHVDDTESLLPGGPSSSQSNNNNNNNNTKHAKMQAVSKEYFNGLIKPQTVGNMTILFPENYFNDDQSAPWGVLGPQPMGPFCVWLLICVATHLIVQRALTIGVLTTLTCYGFYCFCTYRLVDVAFRDPGMCFYQAIPETLDEEQARQWRWCDFCNIFQPPDGAHCTQCDVCIEGYDHYCVWMGTCIGKKNYKQFVKFNVSWLWYLLYYLVWVLLIGHFIKK